MSMKLSKEIAALADQHLKSVDWRENSEWMNFMESVSVMCMQSKLEKMSMETNAGLAQKEYMSITSKLKEEKSLREQSIEKLLASISILDEGEEQKSNFGQDDLLQVAEYLNEQVNRRKEIELELKEAIQIAEKASNAKSQFLSNMSHEIRSPLNVIIGMAHILQKEDHLQGQKENIEILNIASNSLMLLINDILDINKIESGKLELENTSFDLRSLMNNLIKAHKSSAAEKRNHIGVQIDENIEPFYNGDVVRIGQVLTNLVSNANKFTNNGAVEISAKELERTDSGSLIRFGVKDTGIGISEENQNRIFDKFTQAESSITRKFGGSGLGLSISKELLGLMKSKLHIESSLGAGSYFYFDLFLECSVQQRLSQSQFETARDLGGARILVVDDLDYNVIILNKILNDWNVVLDSASDGMEAVEKIQSNQYDMVLMDLQMPVMDGRGATEEIRKFNQETPIIALTASTDVSLKTELLQIGMNDYITKPFNPKELYLKLERSLCLFEV